MKTLLHTAAASLLALSVAQATVAKPTAEQSTRLQRQNYMDYDVPLSQATWIGTHNSYNASKRGYYLVNQKHGMITQLDYGFRVLNYDLYDDAGKIRLCHGVCLSEASSVADLGIDTVDSVLDEFGDWAGVNVDIDFGNINFKEDKLSDTLEELADWLDDHPDEMILIIIEDGLSSTGEHNDAADIIRNKLDEYLYTPEFDTGDNNNDCRYLPVSTLTKRDIINSGKQVVMTTAAGCNAEGDWRNVVWELKNTAYLADEYLKEDDMRESDSLSMVYEDRSAWGAMLHCPGDVVIDILTDAFESPESFFGFLGDVVTGGVDEQAREDAEACIDKWTLSGPELKASIVRGAGIIGMDFGLEEVRHEGAIWSWREDEPSGGDGKNCAVHYDRKWETDYCDVNNTAFACQTIDGEWKVVSGSGNFSDGPSICEAEGYYFSAPVNAGENKKLEDVIIETGERYNDVALNATDEEREGHWVLSYSWDEKVQSLVDGSIDFSVNRIEVNKYENDASETSKVYWHGRSINGDKTRVFLSAPSYRGVDPGVMQATKVSSAFSEVRFKEWDNEDGTHKFPESFDLLAISDGVRRMDDGSVWEVGTFKIDGTKNFVEHNFDFDFPKTPVVILTIQNVDSEEDVAVVRMKDLTQEGFKAALLEQESLNDGHGKVEVAYLAIYKPNKYSVSTINIAGLDYTYKLRETTLDEKWKAIGPYEYMLEEETSMDDEVLHKYETVHLLEIGGAAFIQQITNEGDDPTAIRRR